MINKYLYSLDEKQKYKLIKITGMEDFIMSDYDFLYVVLFSVVVLMTSIFIRSVIKEKCRNERILSIFVNKIAKNVYLKISDPKLKGYKTNMFDAIVIYFSMATGFPEKFSPKLYMDDEFMYEVAGRIIPITKKLFFSLREKEIEFTDVYPLFMEEIDLIIIRLLSERKEE